jgi:hypothetical protein
MKTIKRREFIKTVSAGSVGLAMLNNIGLSLQASSLDGPTGFIGGLTHFAILDDIARLAVAGKQITLNTAQLITADINNPIAANLSRMGAVVEVDGSKAKEALIKAGSDLQQIHNDIASDFKSLKGMNTDLIKKKYTVQKKLALLLGWYMASGIRDYLNPLYANNTNNSNLPSEMSVYHDMFVLKQAAEKQPGHISEKDLASLFHGLQPRAICRTHTITPDYDDGMGWTKRMHDWRNDSRLLMEKYAQVYLNPEEHKMEKYIHEMNFYNTDDLIIQLARWAQDGKPLKEIDKQLKIESYNSIYAKTLISGILSLKAADKLLPV